MQRGTSKRGLRRHHKARKVLRQLRILDARYAGSWYAGRRDSRALCAHINCNCMGQKDEPLARDLRRLED